MRGPIRTPILLPFGNRNTPVEPHRAVSCANKPGQQRHARSIVDRSLPCLLCPSMPRFAEPRRACDDVHRQTFLASPAVPHQTFHARSRLACHACPGHAFPCLPIPAFLAMPAVRCRASIAPGLVTPCLPTPPFNATSYHACRTEPVLQHPATPDPAMPLLLRLPCPARGAHQTLPAVPCPSPTTPSQPCLTFHAWPHLACQNWPGQAVPTKPCLPCLSSPVLDKPLEAMPATPSRLGRSDLSGPCLPRQPLRAPATPSAPCLPCQSRPTLSCQACQPLPLRSLPSQPCQFMSAEGLPKKPPPPTQPL
jgi:hypothetical protein